MNLQQLRDYIRVQLDMDEEELPSALLDSYLSEGFLRTMGQEVRWPFYEKRWEVAKIDGLRTVAIPQDCDPVGIMALIDTSSGARLMQIGSELADDNFVLMSAEGIPCYYTIENMTIYLHPSHEEGTINYLLRGHRYSTDWVAEGPDAEPDCDVRMHQLLAHYAIALCYAQQEDEVLEDVYMKRWNGSFITAHNAICSPRHHRPVIFNGGLPVAPGSQPAQWNLPVS